MPITDFAKRLIGHAALALAALFFCLLVQEKLIPGFVAPSLDLPQLGLAAATMILAGAALNRASFSRWRGFVSGLVFFAVLAACVFFLATRVFELGVRGYALLAASVLVGLVGYHTLWHARHVD
jgi:hypothetical protein